MDADHPAKGVLFARRSTGNQFSLGISGLQSEVDSLKTFKQRKEEIERRSAEFRAATSNRLRALRAQSATLRSAKFNVVIRSNPNELNDLFDAFGDNSELARFLVLEGYLDDTYYQYTSLFHSGRLSPNDYKYLIQIRGFINPEPDFPIDNAKEIVAAMRDEDFRQRYVLNVKIVDCLLSDEMGYADHIARMFDYLSSKFEEGDAFFASYYAAGTQVATLISGLQSTWTGFIPTIIADLDHLPHVGQVIAHLPQPALEALPSTYPEISPFLSSNLAKILALGVDVDPSRLKALRIKLRDLAGIEKFPGIARFLFEEGLYTLTVQNLEFIVSTVLGFDDLKVLRTRHFTTIVSIGNAILSSRIERDFTDYLKNVLLKLDTNSQESVAAVLAIIARDDVDYDDLAAFLGRQTATLPSLADVAVRLHPLVFQLGRIEAAWANCLAFIESETFDGAVLTEFLETEAALAALSKQPIPDTDKEAELRKFLINDDALGDATYRTYVKGLPNSFKNFPADLGPGKLRTLIEEGKVNFTVGNVEALQDHADLQVLFVVRNVEAYLKDRASFALGDDFDEKLLAEDIGDGRKLKIIDSMDLTSMVDLPVRAGKVGAIMDRTGADVSDLDSAVARAILLSTKPISVQISLFNKCEKILSDDDVRDVLAALPAPYSEITRGRHQPRIDKTDANIKFAEWLTKRNIISSWGETIFGDAIRINLRRSKPDA